VTSSKSEQTNSSALLSFAFRIGLKLGDFLGEKIQDFGFSLSKKITLVLSRFSYISTISLVIKGKE
jgi:hypothetical protein